MVKPKRMIVCLGCNEYILHGAKGLCRNCYQKEYGKSYKEKHKEETKKYNKQYKDKHKEKAKEYKLKNSDRIKKYRKRYTQLPEVKKRNIEKAKEYETKHPERKKAINYANRNKQKGKYCKLCNFYKNLGNKYGIYIKQFLSDKTKLQFHHTNYILNEGITLCLNHHIELHKQLRC